MNSLRSTSALLFAGLALTGCTPAKPQAIRYGQDECAECKMTLVNPHYGAELLTAKGKIFKFDDLNCLLAFQNKTKTTPAPQAYIIDCNRPNTFLTVEHAIFLQHDGLRTPMGSHLAAFANVTDLETARSQLGGGGQILRWPDILHPASAEKTATCKSCCSAAQQTP